MLKKFIGPERATVVINGVSFGEVDPGQKLAVPDDVGSAAKWSPKLWEDVKSPDVKQDKETDK